MIRIEKYYGLIMIENIFLMTWNPNSTETDQQIITDAAYPDDLINLMNPRFVKRY